MRITCARHADACGHKEKPLPCRRSLYFGANKRPLSETDAIQRCKRWALWGFTIDSDALNARCRHFGRTPRSFLALDASVLSVVPSGLFPPGSLESL